MPLRKSVPEGDATDFLVSDHEWAISIAAPPRPPDFGDDNSVGSASRPGQAGRAGSICTVEGTAGRDRLRGTPGNDVICAYGGNDTILGRGGHDLVYAGPGNDRTTGGGLDVLYGNAGSDRFGAREGRRDRLHRGAGRDSASIDRGRDRVRRVERIS